MTEIMAAISPDRRGEVGVGRLALREAVAFEHEDASWCCGDRVGDTVRARYVRRGRRVRNDRDRSDTRFVILEQSGQN